jgi:tetratricopeptide (TPR) repeat protein
VWNNHNELQALERFKTLPLGRGRTEAAVGHWYMRHDRPYDAEVWLHRALEADANNVNTHILLGVMYAMSGKFESACVAFENAVNLRPDVPEHRQKYVAALLEADRCHDAVPHLVWLAGSIPDNYPYWQRIGEEMTRRRCAGSLPAVYGPLAEAAERRLRSNPGDARAVLFSGISLMYCGRAEEAVVRFRRSLDADPNLAPALINMGMALARLGRTDEARPYLERFLTLYPHHPMAGAAREHLTP